MTTEAALTAKLKEITEALLPPPRVFTKHHDETTAGTPDVSVDWGGATWWVEVKYVRPRSTTVGEVTKRPLQFAMMMLRERACRRAIYMIYRCGGDHRGGSPKPAWVELWLPSALDRRFKDGEASPILQPTNFASPRDALHIYGGVSAEGLAHDLLARMIKGDNL